MAIQTDRRVTGVGDLHLQRIHVARPFSGDAGDVENLQLDGGGVVRTRHGRTGRGDEGRGDIGQIRAVVLGGNDDGHGVDRAAGHISLGHGGDQLVGAALAGRHGAGLLSVPAAHDVRHARILGSRIRPDGHVEGIQLLAGVVDPVLGEHHFLAHNEVLAVGGGAGQHQGQLQALGAQRFLQRRDLAVLMQAAAEGAGAALRTGDADLRLLDHAPVAPDMIHHGDGFPRGVGANGADVVMTATLGAGGFDGGDPLAELVAAALHIAVLHPAAALTLTHLPGALGAGRRRAVRPAPAAPVMAQRVQGRAIALPLPADGADHGLHAADVAPGLFDNCLTPLVRAGLFHAFQPLAAVLAGDLPHAMLLAVGSLRTHPGLGAGNTGAALLKAAVADAALGAVFFGPFPFLAVCGLTIWPAPCPVMVAVNDFGLCRGHHAKQHDQGHQPGKQFAQFHVFILHGLFFIVKRCWIAG